MMFFLYLKPASPVIASQSSISLTKSGPCSDVVKWFDCSSTPSANPAAAKSFFASATLCSKYLALGPKALSLGSSHQPVVLSLASSAVFQRLVIGRPCPSNDEVL